MTKKHFEALADALRLSRPDAVLRGCENGYDEAQAETWLDVRRCIADVCARFNPGFDRERFIAATERE